MVGCYGASGKRTPKHVLQRSQSEYFVVGKVRPLSDLTDTVWGEIRLHMAVKSVRRAVMWARCRCAARARMTSDSFPTSCLERRAWVVQRPRYCYRCDDVRWKHTVFRQVVHRQRCRDGQRQDHSPYPRQLSCTRA